MGIKRLLPDRLARLRTLRRYMHWTAWRFLLLVGTDPQLEPTFKLLTITSPKGRLEYGKPWFAFTALEYLAKLDLSGKRVLEWGAGASTVWFIENNCQVTSIEDNEEWYRAVKAHVFSERLELIYEPNPAEYVGAAGNLSSFDMLVIDGVERESCALAIIDELKKGRLRKGTFVLVDDSQRSEYFNFVEELSRLCSRSLSFSGPAGFECYKITTIFVV